jgi:4-diphosphocytidyl-2-C-methyl-D-erythritol kinase
VTSRAERPAATLFAPAKINLYLHVTGKRADGYHLLDSLVVFAGAGDRLSFAESDHLALTLSGPSAPLLSADDDNLVLRAARLLAERLGRPAAAAIELEKHLPVAAGIGGGSADAAATLRGLLALWRAELDEAALRQLALALGADLPVCLAGRPTQMAGIGEILAPAVALPPAWLLLVNPRLALSTPAVFKARQGEFSEPAPLTASPRDARDLAAMLAERRNDLAAPAMTLAPAVGRMLDALAAESHCLLARMSGSGATCFGLYGDPAAAEQAAERLRRDQPGWWVAAAPMLG